jgi:hypothetical protein
VARLDNRIHPHPCRRRGGLTPEQAAAVAGLIDAVAGLDAGQRRRLDHHLQDESDAEETETADDVRRTVQELHQT